MRWFRKELINHFSIRNESPSEGHQLDVVLLILPHRTGLFGHQYAVASCSVLASMFHRGQPSCFSIYCAPRPAFLFFQVKRLQTLQLYLCFICRHKIYRIGGRHSLNLNATACIITLLHENPYETRSAVAALQNGFKKRCRIAAKRLAAAVANFGCSGQRYEAV